MHRHVSGKAGSERLFCSKLNAVTKVKMKISKLNTYTILFTKEALIVLWSLYLFALINEFKKKKTSKCTLFSEFGIEEGEIVCDLQKFFVFFSYSKGDLVTRLMGPR